MGVVVFGSLNVDVTLDVPRLPAWGETLPAAGNATSAGGKGANQAAAAGRLGAPVLMVGCTGDDEGGALVRAALSDAGVDVGAVTVRVGEPTGGAYIVRDDHARNCILVVPGANAYATASALQEITVAGDRTVLVLQLETPAAEVLRAAEHGRRLGWHVLLNAAPAEGLTRAMLAGTDTLVVNEHEAALVSGLPVTDAGEAALAAEALRALGPSQVAVTLGPAGAVLLSPAGCWHAPAPDVVSVDSTGAGDAFVAALAVATYERFPERAALRFAVATGAVAVTRAGAQTAMPRRDQVAALADQVRCTPCSS